MLGGDAIASCSYSRLSLVGERLRSPQLRNKVRVAVVLTFLLLGLGLLFASGSGKALDSTDPDSFESLLEAAVDLADETVMPDVHSSETFFE